MSAEQRQTSLLVVDDEAIIRDLCARALKEYRIFEAGSLQEAFELYQTEQIDLVLTDVMMPGGSGIELLRQIKSHDPGAVVVVMTGFGDKEVILTALKEDADDFINKPLQLLQLRTAVQKALSKKALKDELAAMKRLDSLKGSFLSLISHKLRTPLTSLSLALDALQRAARREHGDESACSEDIRSMREDVQFLSRLVTSLLRFNQIMVQRDSKTMVCDLALVVRDAAEAAAQAADKPALALELALASVTGGSCDPERLTFALQQVVDNAFKFSEQGAVAVALREEQGVAVIEVRDSGCGIPAEEMPKIFERFYQVDPGATGQVPGFGLGLFCAREIIRQHGGTISVESEPERGTTVTIQLPIAKE